LDWSTATHADKIFGNCRHRARLTKTSGFKMEGPGSDEDLAFLKGETLKDGFKSHFLGDDEMLVQCWAEQSAQPGWKAEQVWGFEMVGSERRYTRRVVVWNQGKAVRTRIVYDFRREGKKS
jgi:hypothetical protein